MEDHEPDFWQQCPVRRQYDSQHPLSPSVMFTDMEPFSFNRQIKELMSIQNEPSVAGMNEQSNRVTQGACAKPGFSFAEFEY